MPEAEEVIPSIGANKFTGFAMLAATAGIFIHFLFAGNIRALTTSAGLWGYALSLAIFSTVIPSFMISNGLKRIGANNVAIISGIGPVATIVQAHYMLGEKIFAEQIIGTLLVIAGVLLIGWKRKKLSEKKDIQ
ncbi:MAG: DMT family transporter [Segetibacter sp.]